METDKLYHIEIDGVSWKHLRKPNGYAQACGFLSFFRKETAAHQETATLYFGKPRTLPNGSVLGSREKSEQIAKLNASKSCYLILDLAQFRANISSICSPVVILPLGTFPPRTHAL